MVRDGEGRPKALKSLLAAKELQGLLGRLGDSIKVDEGWRIAVAAALNESASAMVVEDKNGVHAAAKHLLSGEHGRGLLIMRKETGSTLVSPSFKDENGVSGPLATQVKSKGKSAKVIENLLKNVWIVEDLTSLLKFSESAQSEGISLVTPDGCFLSQDGFLAVGQVDPQDLGAANLLEETLEEVRQIEKSISDILLRHRVNFYKQLIISTYFCALKQ